MARGFGIGNFGDAYFGVTKYVDVSAQVDATSTFNAVAAKTASTGALTAGDTVTSAIAVVTYSGTATVFGDSSATMGGQLVREISATSSASASMTPSAVTVNNISLSLDASVSSGIDILRVRTTDVTILPELTTTVTARYKYEPVAKDNETWTDVPTASGTWTEVA